jgi:hypothetical protein
MSHAPPITLQITATRHDHTYQGTESAVTAAETRPAVRSCIEDATEIVSAMMNSHSLHPEN